MDLEGRRAGEFAGHERGDGADGNGERDRRGAGVAECKVTAFVVRVGVGVGGRFSLACGIETITFGKVVRFGLTE